ncbi:MAG TPA: adenylate/guanylate cyclase domain-containing protein [Myxococcota bacterium]|nr:adenylate/guanylate cyclase domain-containing protein [Myxococcota bacterium]HRY94854.1 adenylate/guanylate cyclase domain-containing protein [Myxococcota bacterium]HSA23562.1 adenylate/guanylate cyclase domain-containing protein [Myxococcota bacterium]
MEDLFKPGLAEEPDGAVAIVPDVGGEGFIQACLEVEPGDFQPEAQVAAEEELRGDYERLRAVYLFHRYTGHERDPRALLQSLLALAFELLPADRGAILLRADEGAPLVPIVSRRRHPEQDHGGIRIPDSILRRAVRGRSAILSGDAQSDLRFQGSASVIRENVRSAMCVPLVGQSEVLGVVHLDTEEATSAFSVRDLRLLSTLAGQAAAVLERARLRARVEAEARLRERLARFLAPEILSEVVERGIDLRAEGRTDRVSVLFCDIRGFTALAERLPPAELVRLLNAFFERMVAVVFRHRGVLDKFIGDAVMAVWGAPIRRPDDALRAVQAGQEMLAVLAEFNRGGREPAWPELAVGVGLNTGEAVIGTVGSSLRMEYTVMGDAVNLAARVCDLAQPGQMLVTESTFQEAWAVADGRRLKVRPLPAAQVRGRSRPVQVVEVLCP